MAGVLWTKSAVKLTAPTRPDELIRAVKSVNLASLGYLFVVTVSYHQLSFI